MKIYDIVFIILFIVSVLTVLWYLFGDSPTLEQGMLIMIATFLISIYGRQIRLETRFGFMAKDFKELTLDFKQHAKH